MIISILLCISLVLSWAFFAWYYIREKDFTDSLVVKQETICLKFVCEYNDDGHCEYTQVRKVSNTGDCLNFVHPCSTTDYTITP